MNCKIIHILLKAPPHELYWHCYFTYVLKTTDSIELEIAPINIDVDGRWHYVVDIPKLLTQRLTWNHIFLCNGDASWVLERWTLDSGCTSILPVGARYGTRPAGRWLWIGTQEFYYYFIIAILFPFPHYKLTIKNCSHSRAMPLIILGAAQ